MYSFDSTAPKKRACARALIKDALENANGVFSSQVAQEFLNVALHRFQPRARVWCPLKDVLG